MDFNSLLFITIAVLIVFLVVALIIWIYEARIERKLRKNGWQVLTKPGCYIAPDGTTVNFGSGGKAKITKPAKGATAVPIEEARVQPAEQSTPEVVPEIDATVEPEIEPVYEPEVEPVYEPEIEPVVDPEIEPVATLDELAVDAASDEYEDTIFDLTENSVLFERNESESKTFAEKYAALPAAVRDMLDKVYVHVMEIEGVKRADYTSLSRVKYKTQEVFTVKIKRGVPVFSFRLANTSLSRYVKEEGIKNIKISPVTIRLSTEDDYKLVIRTTDMAIEQAKEELEYKRARRNEIRRARRNSAK